jgi:hypothetical protein
MPAGGTKVQTASTKKCRQNQLSEAGGGRTRFAPSLRTPDNAEFETSDGDMRTMPPAVRLGPA